MKARVLSHKAILVSGIASALFAALFVAFRCSTAFSEWFCVTVAAAARRVLGLLTRPIPFSLYEVLVVLGTLFLFFYLGVAVFALVRRIVKKKTSPLFRRLTAALLVTLCVLFDLYTLTFAAAYHRRSLAENMALDTASVTESEIFAALETLSGAINEAASGVEKNEAGETVPPAKTTEIAARVLEAADLFAEDHAFFQKGSPLPKALLSSPVLTYTHLSGVYAPFTGEVNVNVNYPHFIVTASLAHETCHARGIGAENECNFLAVVILTAADDPYLNYCGAAFLFSDLYAAARKIDPARAKAILADTDPAYRKDMTAYSRFFEPYAGATASVAANAVNSAYLKSMGQKDGTLSYSMVVELLAAYYGE